MDRTIIAAMEQMRDFDFVSFEHDVLVALGGMAADTFSGLPYGVVGGLAATQTSPATLSINIAAGRAYQIAAADAVAGGSIPQDTTLIVQQGIALAQTVTLVAPSAGQSQWNLIQAQFSQLDAVRAGDPTGGIVPFYNPSNPQQPTSNSINTVRRGVCVIQVVTGTAATTGSEVPPTPSVGWLPLYLIDLTGGQTQISNSQIKVTAPSVGTGVPSNYPSAPFIAGLLASHHGGTSGQAPKINLATEVQGVLPYINMSPVKPLQNSALTIYVNGSTGSDTNNGLTPTTAFRTIAAAVNSLYHAYDHNGFNPTVSVANGTYAVSAPPSQWAVPCNGLPTGATALSIIGNTASPGSVTLSVTTGSGFLSQSGCNVNISGFTVTASGSQPLGQGFGFDASNGQMQIGNCVVGSCSGAQISTVVGFINIIAPITFTGNATAAFNSANGGIIAMTNQTITMSGTPVYTASMAYASQTGTIYSLGSTFIGTCTGPRYNANLNGVIFTNGAGVNLFPGSTAGATATGGQYA